MRERCVALLGSVNVGGNRLAMADLRAALEEHGFEDVRTVVASGNVLFAKPDTSPERAGAAIADIVRQRFGFDTLAIVHSAASLAAALAENPFAADGEDKLVHTHFLEAQPTPGQFDQLLADHAGRGIERLAPGTRALHIDFVDGAAGSKLTGPFMAKRLGCRGTARNIRSIGRILEALKEKAS